MERKHLRQAFRGDPECNVAVHGLQQRGAAVLGQLAQHLIPAGIVPRIADSDEAESHQRLMHLVDVARLRPRLLAHRLDRAGVQPAEVVSAVGVGIATSHDRLRAALFQRGIVEEGVGACVQRLGRERRRRGQVARDDGDLAAFQSAQHVEPALRIHGLVQAIVQRLRDQRMVGHFALADEVLGAGDLVRKHGGQQVFAAHALQLRRDLGATAETRQRQCGGRVPAPAHVEQRRIEQRLHQHVAGRRGMQVTRDVDQRKTVAGRQRQHDRVFGRRRLQLEVELSAETLAQRQAPGAVDAAAERRVDDELRAAGFIEETFDDDGLLGGQHADRRVLPREIVVQLPRSIGCEADCVAQPRQRCVWTRFQLRGIFRTQPRHAHRQFVRAPRRLAQPERNAGRCALRILHAHAAGFDAQDAVAGIAELEHIASEAFDREILVDVADADRLRLEDDRVIGHVGNGASGHHRRHARVVASAQAAMHGVAMQVAGARAAARGESVCEHPHDGIEILAREPGIRPCAAQPVVQGVLAPLTGANFGHDLLRQHVQRRARDRQRVEFTAPHAVQQRRAFDQIVAR